LTQLGLLAVFPVLPEAKEWLASWLEKKYGVKP
jgi:hypothetical protein